MRLVKNIPHPAFKISLFSLSEKYLLQVEYGPYVQGFKIDQSELSKGTEQIDQFVINEYMMKCLERFKGMDKDWKEYFK